MSTATLPFQGSSVCMYQLLRLVGELYDTSDLEMSTARMCVSVPVAYNSSSSAYLSDSECIRKDLTSRELF